jgi:hypothetical protein
LKYFVRLLENILYAGQRFLNGVYVSRPVECQLKMKNVPQPSTSKTRENVEQIWELIHEDHCQTIHELADTVGISYGVCQEILT